MSTFYIANSKPKKKRARKIGLFFNFLAQNIDNSIYCIYRLSLKCLIMLINTIEKKIIIKAKTAIAVTNVIPPSL